MSMEDPTSTPRRRRNYSNVGIEAVSYANYQAESFADYESLYDGELTEMEKTLGGKLKSQRIQIAGMSPRNKTEMSRALMGKQVSPLVRAIVNRALAAAQAEGLIRTEESKLPPLDLSDPYGPVKAGGTEIITALTHQRPNRRYLMPNNSFLNVLQWYVENGPDPYADYETVRADKYKDEYEDRLRRAVSKGVLPEAALDRVMMLYETPVTVHDGSNNAFSDYNGYFTAGEGAVIQASVLGTPGEIGTTFHEFSHALSMGDLVTRESPIPGFPEHTIRTSNVGFGSAFRGEVERIFNEGMTELTTEALLEREIDRGHYVEERNLIIALIECSDGAISGLDFAKAYFAAEPDDDGTNAALDLLDRLKATYPERIVNALLKLKRDPERTRTTDGVLNPMSKITVALYLDWAHEHARTPEEIERAADRVMEVSEGKLTVTNFLQQSRPRATGVAPSDD